MPAAQPPATHVHGASHGSLPPLSSSAVRQRQPKLPAHDGPAVVVGGTVVVVVGGGGFVGGGTVVVWPAIVVARVEWLCSSLFRVDSYVGARRRRRRRARIDSRRHCAALCRAANVRKAL